MNKEKENKTQKKKPADTRTDTQRNIHVNCCAKCTCMKNICKVNFQRTDYVGDVADAQLLLLLLLWANNNNLFWFSNWRKCDRTALFSSSFSFSCFPNFIFIVERVVSENVMGFSLWKFQSSRQIEAIIMIIFCEEYFC